MGLFSIFSREKKETLNKGLDKTNQSFLSKLSKSILGKSTVDDEVLDSLEETLITSDVGVETTLKIIDGIQERVKRDKYLGISELNGILYSELAELLNQHHNDECEDFSSSLP